jgi:acetoacetate decarboxylase
VAKATLKLFAIKYDPLDEIPIFEILNAAYSKRSMTLGYGKVMHDFNKK